MATVLILIFKFQPKFNNDPNTVIILKRSYLLLKSKVIIEAPIDKT